MDLDSVSMPKRNVLALQLAPMIDIFFLIIIFLLKSTSPSRINIAADATSAPSHNELLRPRAVKSSTCRTFRLVNKNCLNLFELEL